MGANIFQEHTSEGSIHLMGASANEDLQDHVHAGNLLLEKHENVPIMCQ